MSTTQNVGVFKQKKKLTLGEEPPFGTERSKNGGLDGDGGHGCAG